MLQVVSDNIKAQIQSRGPDEQIWEVDAVALTHLFAMDAPGQPRHLQRQRIDGYCLKDLVDKGLSAQAVSIRSGPVDAMS